MRFDLSGETQGEWFKFFQTIIKEDGEKEYLPPAEDAGSVCLRIAPVDVIEEIRTKTRKHVKAIVLNTASKAMERIEYDDQTPEQRKEENRLVMDYAIQDWTGILDKDGNEIPCTSENKQKLMAIPQFARFVGRCLQLIIGANAVSEEAATKNS